MATKDVQDQHQTTSQTVTVEINSDCSTEDPVAYPNNEVVFENHSGSTYVELHFTQGSPFKPSKEHGNGPWYIIDNSKPTRLEVRHDAGPGKAGEFKQYPFDLECCDELHADGKECKERKERKAKFRSPVMKIGAR